MQEPIQRPGLSVERRDDIFSERLTMLCDGVFAIAMTLLVLNIHLSLPSHANEGNFQHALAQLVPSVGTYFLTFLILAAYWNNHRRIMRLVAHQDAPFTALTLLFLAFIAFFPVAANIGGFANNFQSSVIFYTMVLAGCGLMTWLLWIYASWNHRLIDLTVQSDEILFRSLLTLIPPLYFLLSLLLLLIPALAHDPSNMYNSWFGVFIPYRLAILLMYRRYPTLAARVGQRRSF
jgi:uncharacterized membrane protein